VNVPPSAEAPVVGDDLVTPSTLGRRAISGVFWSSVSRFAQQAVQFATAVVLARLLAPADFGLVAEVIVFTSFAWLLIDFGFSAALIQREKLEERHLSSAFWLNVGIGAVLTLVTVAISPAIAAFYHQPRLRDLTLALSGAFVLGSLGIVQGTVLERDLNFRRLAVITNGATLAGGVVGISAAVAGAGVWSIVAEALVGTGMRSLLLWVSSDWSPALLFDRQAVKDLWGFSANLAAFNSVNFWARNADNVLVGRFVAPAALGIYGRAYTLMMIPLNQVTSTISVAMYPVLARLQGNRELLRDTYLKLVEMIAIVAFPVATGLFVVAHPFVLTLYGQRWAGVVGVLQILCIPLLVQSVGSTVGLVYQTCGRTDWLLRWGVIASATTVAGFAIGIHWGIRGVAASYAIVSVPLFYFSLLPPGKLIGASPVDVLRAVRFPFAAAVAMAAVMWGAGRVVEGLGTGGQLGVEIAVGVVVYSALTTALSIAPLAHVVALYRGSRLKA
jgi:O-antigen/teichoic acid export membrane protein